MGVKCDCDLSVCFWRGCWWFFCGYCDGFLLSSIFKWSGFGVCFNCVFSSVNWLIGDRRVGCFFGVYYWYGYNIDDDCVGYIDYCVWVFFNWCWYLRCWIYFLCIWDGFWLVFLYFCDCCDFVCFFDYYCLGLLWVKGLDVFFWKFMNLM